MAKEKGPEKSKLKYAIKGKRKVEGDTLNLDYIDVEWSREDGQNFKDIQLVPLMTMKEEEVMLKDGSTFVNLTPVQTYEERPAGTRVVVKDQIVVLEGTKDSIIMQMIEEKRENLEKAFGLK